MLKALILAASILFPPAHAAECPYDNLEARVTEAITAEDKVFVIEGETLDLFIKNANQLYNIGWQRETIGKIYAIEATQKAQNEHFQVWHLFFVDPTGCIAYYQTVYGAVLHLVLSENPLP